MTNLGGSLALGQPECQAASDVSYERVRAAVDLDLFRALLAPAGQDLLAEACAHYDERSAVTLAGRLRGRYPADLVAAAMTQAALRNRARAKWGEEAARMYFTRPGLEQATTGLVAAYRAGRIGPAAGGPVADLCCGIGGDLLALARAGLDVVGVDRDPVTAEIARANLAALDLADRARVEVADVTTFDRSAYAGVVADPARRSARGRVFDPVDYSPPWSFVEELLAGDACVKTAPIIPHRLVPRGVEAEWISADGEVREAALWSGRLRAPAPDGSAVRHRATVLPGGASLTDADDPGEAPVSPPRTYLYEPDGAVIRAGLVTAVAPVVDGALLHPKIAYLTSDRLVPTPFATAYQIDAVLPYDTKTIRRELRARDVGTLTVKKRGVDVSPEVLRKRLGIAGSHATTLVVTRAERGTLALLVTPVAS